MTLASTSVLSVRVNSREHALLRNAAGRAQTNLSDFIRRRAIEAAEIDLLERTTVTIPAEKWKAFEAWVDAPAKEVPALRKLSTAHLAWQD
jgi:uncharacterized protein (DUF1778 family)